jgi:NADPH2:quinone reductase
MAGATADAGGRPGWDLAGTVEQAAADGSGPPRGARVVGILDSGAWAQLVAVPTTRLAELPEGVSFAQAATLPIAGLTALWTLERGGLLLGRTVLVTGATGGVGNFVCQLARRSGARVVGVVGRPEHAEVARAAGAHEVVVGHDLSGAESFGPYHLVLDSVGGPGLAAALPMIAHGGECVVYGTTASPQVTLDVRDIYTRGGVRLYGFIIFYEMTRRPPAEDLGRLAGLVADGRLRPPIEVEASWREVSSVAQQLTDRRFTGKAVLHVGE